MTDFFVYQYFYISLYQGIWFGILHHIVDEHQWVLPYSTSGVNGCEHDDLEEHKYRESKEYIQKGSLTHETLRSIIMNKRLLNKIPYFLNFRYAVSYCISAQFK